MTYAADTKVPVDRTRAEIERTLTRYGATSFGYGWDQGGAVVMFEAQGRRVRFVLPLPDRADPAIARTPTGLKRSAAQIEDAFGKAERARWRALLLIIRAKLEAVEAGIVSFEEEFLAHTMLPSGSTVGQWVGPQLAEVYATGTMPALLPGGPS